jgi:hypothetical protein
VQDEVAGGWRAVGVEDEAVGVLCNPRSVALVIIDKGRLHARVAPLGGHLRRWEELVFGAGPDELDAVPPGQRDPSWIGRLVFDVEHGSYGLTAGMQGVVVVENLTNPYAKLPDLIGFGAALDLHDNERFGCRPG